MSDVCYLDLQLFDPDLINVATVQGRNNKENLYISYGPLHKAICFVTPVCETRYPRVSGDGNLNTTFGPTDVKKAQFTLDLHDVDSEMIAIDSANKAYPMFSDMLQVLAALDNALLKFVYKHQAKLLGRKNLSLDEVKMLQIPSSKVKVDRWSGEMQAPTFSASAKKYYRDQVWNERERVIKLVDFKGQPLPEGATVMPGDLVQATVQVDNVYSGVGGDKFGIHWTFHDVCVVCQGDKRSNPASNNAFAGTEAHPAAAVFA